MAAATLSQGIAALFNSARFSDLKIQCREREWHTHKNVLCTQSQFFASACEGGFREAEEACIHLPNDEPEVVEAMLKYLYMGDYEQTVTAENDAVGSAVFNVRVFSIAEKYFIHHLGSMAVEKFVTACHQNWATDDFADAVAEATNTTSDDLHLLRDTIITVIMKHKDELFKSESEHQHFKDVFAQTPGIAALVAEKLVTENDEANLALYKCPTRNCKFYFRSTRPPPRARRSCSNCGQTWRLDHDWKRYIRDAPTILGDYPVDAVMDEDSDIAIG